MSATHDHHHEAPAREREVIVTDTGRSSGVGTVFAAVIGVLLVLLVGWMFFSGFGGDGGEGGIDVPDEVNVNVDPGSGGEGGGAEGGSGQ